MPLAEEDVVECGINSDLCWPMTPWVVDEEKDKEGMNPESCWPTPLVEEEGVAVLGIDPELCQFVAPR